MSHRCELVVSVFRQVFRQTCVPRQATTFFGSNGVGDDVTGVIEIDDNHRRPSSSQH